MKIGNYIHKNLMEIKVISIIVSVACNYKSEFVGL